MKVSGMVVPVTEETIGPLLERAKAGQLLPSDHVLIVAFLGVLLDLCKALADRDISMRRLRRMLFGPSTENARKVLKPEAGTPGEGGPAPHDDEDPSAKPEEKPKKKPKGHGQNGVDQYQNAKRVLVPLAHLQNGDTCPKCHRGKVYILREPGKEPRIYGQAMIAVVIYELQKGRCNGCGEIFTAELPAEAGTEKFDATAGSMAAILKYGTGVPFNRLENLQADLQTPLPASIQWDIVNAVANKVEPAHEELVRRAAQGKVVYNDDTGMTILSMPETEQEAQGGNDPSESPERTGVFTTGIVSEGEGHKVALFCTGRKHAGENMDDVLREREPSLPPPIQMCDALSRNEPKEFETILSNCLAHARRKFVDVATSFPDECRHLLESLRAVYRNDALAKEQALSDEDRLRLHQAHSQPIMDDLKKWLQAQFDEKKVEPNSGLGKAISYMLKRWDRLTLFLTTPGAPLDNNLCERVLKMAILNRKNSYFYKTERGARVGDILMSLIYTCRLNGVNPFEYLTALQRHADRVRLKPSEWLPWNYKEALAALNTS